MSANHLNTAFAITFASGSFKIVFAAPLNETIYLNASLFYVEISSINARAVDLGQFKQGITTVDYTLATAPNPAGLTRVQWIDAVLALNPTGGGGPPLVLTPSAPTDSWVGYNHSTQQLTDFGNRSQWGFRVTKDFAQPLFFNWTGIFFNVIEDDELSQYDQVYGAALIANSGYYTFGASTTTDTTDPYTLELFVDPTGGGGGDAIVAKSGTNFYSAHISTSMYLTAGSYIYPNIRVTVGGGVTSTVATPNLNVFWCRANF